MNLQDWLTGSLANKLLSTTILIVAVLIIRKYVVHWIKSKETFLWSDFVFHLMTIPIKANAQWQKAEDALLHAARDVSAPYLDQARQVMQTQALQQNLEQPSIEPRVQIQITDPEKYNLILCLPVPARMRARLEQDIARHYLKLMGSADKGPPESNT